MVESGLLDEEISEVLGTHDGIEAVVRWYSPLEIVLLRVELRPVDRV